MAQGKVEVVKVKGEENPADAGTKYLTVAELRERLRRMSIELVGSGEGACKAITPSPPHAHVY